MQISAQTYRKRILIKWPCSSASENVSLANQRYPATSPLMKKKEAYTSFHANFVVLLRH